MMEHPSFPYVFTVVHILVVSHTCINPFIYCWMNRRVRYGFMDVMGEKLGNDFVDASGPMAEVFRYQSS